MTRVPVVSYGTIASKQAGRMRRSSCIRGANDVVLHSSGLVAGI